MSEIKTWQERMGPHYVYDRALNCAQAEIAELRAFIGDLPEAQNELLKINKANMAEIARLKELLSQALGALKSIFSFEVDPERGARCSAAIQAIEKEGIK